MSINIESEAWCRKAYLNYHCYGNSMGITASEMGEITSRWESKLKSWQATVAKDENEYEFDDSDYSSYKENGRKAAQDQTGYSGDDGGNVANGIASSAGAVGGATLGIVGAVKSGTNIISGLEGAISTSYSVGKVAGGEGATNFSRHASGSAKLGEKPNACAYIAAGLAIATAAMYRVIKPNKTEANACNELQNVMENNKIALSETQADMENMSSELIELSDEANEANEQANGDIEEEKTKYDMYRASYERLKTKVDSGEPLTEDEKAEWQELVKYMTATGENITTTQEETTELVGEIYDDMGTYQEGYDYAAETMGEVEGTTNFAAGFDETTRRMCFVEGSSQALNAISGAVAGAQLMGMGFWNWALGIASIGAGISSGFASSEQFAMASKVGTEIDMRKDTQDFNTETMDIYTEEVDAYDGFMQGVNDLELEIPVDVAPPEETAVPTTPQDGLPEGTPDTIKPKKEDEK